MAYNLDAWVAKREILDALGVPCVALPQGFALTIHTPDFVEPFEPGIAWLHASFFGGFGEQESTLRIFGEKISFGPSYDAINEALSRLGVVRTAEHDEFDSLGLGKHRDNDWMPEPDIFGEDDLPY